MTEIKGPQTPLPIQQPKIEKSGSQPGNLSQGQTQRNWRDQSSQQEGGPHRSNSSVFVSQNALESRIAALQGDDERNPQDGTPDQEDTETPEQLLISLDAGKPTSPETLFPKDTATADRMAKAETLANQVAHRMEQAMRGSSALPAGEVSMTLKLDAQTGLSGVQVTMSDGVLSVVLLRGADAADVHLQLAAANLAQILQSRFPSRQIKISEKPEDARIDQAREGASETETGFAHLFRTERDMT